MKDEKRMELPKVTLDDLFTTQEERANKNIEKIIEIPIEEISDFPNHPYKVIDNEEMKELSESIKENGLFNPIIVRPKKNGGYEMVSGHRRKRASEFVGIAKIKAIVKDLTDDEVFIDSYQLLTSNVKFKMDDFMDLMRTSSNNTNTAKELETLNNQYKDLIAKKDKLLDFLIEDKITQKTYEEKIEKFERKLEIIEHRQEQLNLLKEDKESIKDGLKKIQNILKTNDVLKEFDQEVFDALIDYIIVGGYDENGVMNPFIIRFVLKREFDLRVRNEISKELIVANNKLDLNTNNVILDFINTRQYYYFDINENGNRTKILQNGLRIRVECDIT